MNQRGNVLSWGCFRNGTRVIPFSLEDSTNSSSATLSNSQLQRIRDFMRKQISLRLCYKKKKENCENASRELVVADR